MSTMLVELLGLLTATTHTIELDLPRVELRLELTDPRTNAPVALPAGPMVSLVSGTGVVLDRAAVDADGCVHLLGDPAAVDVHLEIELGENVWLDLAARAWVVAADVRAGDPRPLLRLPRRWRSDEQSSFSDDRGGAFALGVLGSLIDGELGTADAPWVLRIDHAWPKRLLELRYSNTHKGTQEPLPPGALVEVAHDVGAPKLRLAGASTVLDDSGTTALWIFDRSASLGDLRILLRTAPDSYVAMDEPGTIVRISPAEHRRSGSKARARLHPLPVTLRLHEQPGQQGAQRGVLGSLLPLVAGPPARVVVPIDVLVELRLVLHDPVTGSPKPLPADVEVVLTDGRDQSIAVARTAEDGRATLFAPPGTRDVGIEISFTDAPYLDLLDAKFVASDDAEPNTKLKLVRLPDRWRSIDQAQLSDDRGGAVVDGRLPSLVAGELGTVAAPWELDVGHAWQRTELVFQYYDVTAKAVRPLPFGPLIEAFDGARLRDRDLVAASTVLDLDGRVHLMCFRAVDPAKLRIRMRTAPESVVVTTEPNPELRIRSVGAAALAAMPVGDRQSHYRLPAIWLSRGQACRTNDKTSAPASFFEDAVGSALSTSVLPPRLYFDLDDFVLVNRAGVPLRFVRELDLTIFHHDMSIRAPRTEPPPTPPKTWIPLTHRPYFSRVQGALNHFTGNNAFYTPGKGPERTARVIRRGTTFYDLTDVRTTRGRIVGVRAAVAENHPHEHIFLKHQPGTSPNLANCHLHYFEDVAADPLVPTRSISVLMVFFSVRIRNLCWTTTSETGATVPRMINTGRQGALQDALRRATERWSGATLADVLAGVTPDVPDVRLRTDDGRHDVKFVFHFPAFDDREGNAVIWIRPKPRAFSLSTFGLIVVDQNDSDVGTSVTDVESGHSYDGETIAHELGHSMGLGDEYFESETPDIPKLRQYAWDFLHFSFDRRSMMHDECVPRLRHYWVFSRWLERNGAIGAVRAGAYAIVCDTSAVTAPLAGRGHAFRLPPDHAWPYEPAREEPNFRPGVAGRGHLRLFLLGDDLDAFRLPSTGVLSGIDAILYWDLTLYVRRRANVDGAMLSVTSKDRFVSRIYGEMAAAIGAVTFRGGVARCLVAELDTAAPATAMAQRHVKKALVYVLPRITYSNPGAADFRLHVRPRSSTPGADLTDLHDPSFRSRKIDVHEEIPGAAILRCITGIGTAAARPGAAITLASTPLSISSWFSIGTNTMSTSILQAVHGARTPGAGDFDASGTPSQVAADIAAAINDPLNAFSGHLSATASGSRVALTGKPAGADVVVNGTAPGTSIHPEWRDDIEPAEVSFLAQWLGAELGATYRIKAYD